jgi:hypothetical protein
MNKFQFTVRFLFNKILFRLALLGSAFFLLTNLAFASKDLKIAMIDTGFCTEKIKVKNIKLEEINDFTKSVKFGGNCSKFDKFAPRFHGQLVLEEFIKYFDHKKKNIQIYPLVVFDEAGNQKKEYWLKAIEWIKKNNIEVVVTAAGFITTEKIVSELPGLWFVPSGRVTPQIKKVDSLFPQNLAPMENLFLIGDFYDGRQVLYDQGLLFQDKIDYYFPAGLKGFVGTSRAVAEGSARAINLCPISTMRDCLKKLEKVYNDNLSRRKIQTF